MTSSRILFFTILLLSCDERHGNHEVNGGSNAIYKDSFVPDTEKENLKETGIEGVEKKSAVDSSRKMFGKSISFLSSDSILSYEVKRSNDKNCLQWKIPSKKELLTILKHLQEVSGSTWHDCYGDWSCGVEGDIVIQGKKCKYYFDAGGWVIIGDGKKQKFYGCKNPYCLKYFPSDCFCDEYGNMVGE